jgi:hypothetical protein
VFMCVNAYICRHNGLEYAKKQAEMRHANRERLNTTGTIDTAYSAEITTDDAERRGSTGGGFRNTVRKRPDDVVIMSKTLTNL